MLVRDKKIYKIKRKRKYSLYEPKFQKSKEYKSKKLKSLNCDFVNENRIIWKKWTK